MIFGCAEEANVPPRFIAFTVAAVAVPVTANEVKVPTEVIAVCAAVVKEPPMLPL